MPLLIIVGFTLFSIDITVDLLRNLIYFLSGYQVRCVRRDNSAKVDIPMNNLVEEVKDMFANIQQNLFDVAKQKRDASIQVTRTWDEFTEALNEKKLILAPWCDEKVIML